jgi:hypothetical protein
MQKLFLSLFALVLSAALMAQKTVNDPNAEIREAKNFHEIRLSSAFDVYLSQSDEEAVAVSTSDIKYRDRIKVEVKEGILSISYDSKGLNWGSGNKKLKAYISFKQLDKLDISGACDVFITGTIKSDQLSITQSGASDFKGKLDVNKLTVDLSGASDMVVSGMVTNLHVEVSGASNFKGYELITEICNVKASGASDIKVTVNKELSAQASGASDVRYKGSGFLREIKSSGSSSISKG